ncbi:MAG: threonine aldolase family protein [Acidimicrobiia bacterium]
MDPIELRSDNAAGVAPEIMEAMVAANTGTAIAYGDDPLTAELQQRVRQVFEHDTARVFPVTSGTAANALSLSAMCPPWGAVLCHETAHIKVNEGGATSLLSSGAVMHGIAGPDFRMSADALRATLAATRWGDNHQSQPSVLSFTQPTDFGTVYPGDEIAELSAIAREHGMSVHVDGARVANALVALGCTPAELTWKAGVDALSLGSTKNGGGSAEAIVVFDDAVAAELVYRTKRSGHVTSKMRFQSAQLLAHLTDDLWLRLARHANERMAELASGLAELDVRFINRPDVNMLFVELPDDRIVELERQGLLFYRMGPGRLRLVTSWATTPDQIEDALARFRAVVR